MLGNKLILDQDSVYKITLCFHLSSYAYSISNNLKFTRPFPEPDESNPPSKVLFLKVHFNIIISFTSRSSKEWSLS